MCVRPRPENAKGAPLAGRPKSQKSFKSTSDSDTPPAELQTKKRGGKASRQKGDRAERAIVRFLQDKGLAAERVPLSGAAGGSYLGDVTIPVLGVDRVAEVKVRANGFGQLYAWLEARDLLIVRADRREPLVVLPLKLAAEIAAKAEGSR
jgi:hypothetical protein